MGMKNYKPVYDGVKYKTPMQRMLEEQRKQKEKVENGNGKSNSRKPRDKSE